MTTKQSSAMWQYKNGSIISPPLSRDDVASAVSEGEITPQTLVRPADATEWAPAAETPMSVLFDDNPDNDDEFTEEPTTEDVLPDEATLQELSYKTLEVAFGKDFLTTDAQGNTVLKFMGKEEQFGPGHAIFQAVFMVKNRLTYTKWERNRQFHLIAAAMAELQTLNNFHVLNLTPNDEALFEVRSTIKAILDTAPRNPLLLDRGTIARYKILFDPDPDENESTSDNNSWWKTWGGGVIVGVCIIGLRIFLSEPDSNPSPQPHPYESYSKPDLIKAINRALEADAPQMNSTTNRFSSRNGALSADKIDCNIKISFLERGARNYTGTASFSLQNITNIGYDGTRAYLDGGIDIFEALLHDSGRPYGEKEYRSPQLSFHFSSNSTAYNFAHAFYFLKDQCYPTVTTE